jgi:hypothetical protein
MAEAGRGSLKTLAIAVIVGAVLGAAALLAIGGASIGELLRDQDFAYVRLSSDAGACSVAGYPDTSGRRTFEKSSFVYSESQRPHVTWRVVNDSDADCWLIVGGFENAPTPSGCARAGSAYPFTKSDLSSRIVKVNRQGTANLRLRKLSDYAGATLIYYSLCTAASAGDAAKGGIRVDDPMLRVKR